MTDRPKRAESVDIRAVADGYVVYDSARDRVHYLNHTAAIVLELCDGQQDVEAITAMIGNAYDMSEIPTEEVRECVEQLRAEGMIV